MDFPELGPAVLHLAEIAACDLQLVHVCRVSLLNRVWALYFHLFVERQGAGSERPAERLYLRRQLAVLELTLEGCGGRICGCCFMPSMASGASLRHYSVLEASSFHVTHISNPLTLHEHDCLI